MAPFVLESVLGAGGAHLVYLFIGIAFGAVLEMAGFANSRKLAAQFYFKDMTVLKVMFTAIVVAMVLVFWFSGLHWLDYRQLWVNPTYLWPGIVGGLIMGFGFIIGGFCPGTSLVAVATLKVDGFFFTAGALFGILLFGETVSTFDGFWNSSYLGRFTLPEWLHLSTGVVVCLVVAMALFMFWGSGKLETAAGKKVTRPLPRGQWVGAGTLVVAALGLLMVGQPTPADQWRWIADEKQPLLAQRDIHIHPGELLDLMNNDQIRLQMFDLREEAAFNLFHIRDAQRTTLDQLERDAGTLAEDSGTTVTVLMCSEEVHATDAWRLLTGQGVINLYILEDGVNRWLDILGHEGHPDCANGVTRDRHFRHIFPAALGDRHPASDPEGTNDLIYTPKVKIEEKSAAKKGGCG